jgi:NADPH2:quinone reductase
MKAILVANPGGPEVLQLQDVERPLPPSLHHVRVKLAAAGVNPVDAKLRAKPAYFPDKLPTIPGCDGAGIVDAVGREVTRFKVGDAVYFCNGGIGDEPGCYAEYTTLNEDHCAMKPANLSFEESAALPLVFLTAWESLVERAHLQAEQSVLIHAAAGGVGHVAVQLARHLGALVAVTVSDDEKARLVQDLGAHKVIRYREQDFEQEVMDWGFSHHKGVDVVFDTVGGDVFLRSLRAARIGGKVVSILATPLAAPDAQLARLRNLSICYDLMLAPQVMRLHEERVRQRKILEQCTKLVEAGKLRVLVAHKLPLQQAAEAHRLIEQGHSMGKIVLTMS